ncbi:ABC transporter ATP-binding protein [Corynebacterium sp. 335C]
METTDDRAAGPDLVVDGVAAAYGDGPEILHGASFTARAGTVTTLLGPNGCGKSTLLKTASRLLEPTSGTVRVGDDEVHALSPKEAAQRISLLPQHPSCPPGLTVGELVSRGRHPHRARWGGESDADREAIARALEDCGVAALAGHDVAQLSGGQRQRVWMAMVLAQDTPVVLLDEPTTFLDPAHAIAVLELARGLARRGRAVVMVLHDLMMAGMFSDRVLVLRDGEVVVEGTPAEALTPGTLADVYGLRAEVWDDPAGRMPVIVPRGIAGGA